MAIAVESQFYQTLTPLIGISEVAPDEADWGWYLYALISNPQTKKFELKLERKVYIKFADAMERFSSLQAGDMEEFIAVLQRKLLANDKRRLA